MNVGPFSSEVWTARRKNQLYKVRSKSFEAAPVANEWNAHAAGVSSNFHKTVFQLNHAFNIWTCIRRVLWPLADAHLWFVRNSTMMKSARISIDRPGMTQPSSPVTPVGHERPNNSFYSGRTYSLQDWRRCIMLIFFFDIDRVVHSQFTPHGQTVNTEFW